MHISAMYLKAKNKMKCRWNTHTHWKAFYQAPLPSHILGVSRGKHTIREEKERERDRGKFSMIIG